MGTNSWGQTTYNYPLPANLSANSTLVWDGENRLIEAQVNSGVTVSYVYDSQSRRIAESSTINNQLSTIIYIYDGWNPIAKYTVQNSLFTIHSSFTWGMDLSGSMQGAGGVGGLLAVTDGTGTFYPTFDGNGNVSEYLDTNGNIVAHYEYDPFGKATVSNGTKSNDFAHRFSTKPLDTTTGLYYYGYRFYDPATGRWPSRDPIGEEGGINLYGFINNDGVNRWDLLGLCEEDEWCCIWGGTLHVIPQAIDPWSTRIEGAGRDKDQDKAAAEAKQNGQMSLDFAVKGASNGGSKAKVIDLDEKPICEKCGQQGLTPIVPPTGPPSFPSPIKPSFRPRGTLPHPFEPPVTPQVPPSNPQFFRPQGPANPPYTPA